MPLSFSLSLSRDKLQRCESADKTLLPLRKGILLERIFLSVTRLSECACIKYNTRGLRARTRSLKVKDGLGDRWEFTRDIFRFPGFFNKLSGSSRKYLPEMFLEIASWKKRPIEELVIALLFDQIFYFRSCWTKVPGQSSICIVRLPP